jgi:hypothetical protein
VLLLALYALSRWGPTLHVEDWMETLPFAHQVAAKISFVLMVTVIPFAAVILFSRK